MPIRIGTGEYGGTFYTQGLALKSVLERAPRIPMAERARSQRLESLKLSRSRVEDQLSKAVHPAHRKTLMKALQAIEEDCSFRWHPIPSHAAVRSNPRRPQRVPAAADDQKDP